MDDNSTTIKFKLPYNLTRDEVVLEPHDPKASIANELRWLADEANAEELPRILLSAVVLHQCFPNEHFAQCLSTAIIWERG